MHFFALDQSRVRGFVGCSTDNFVAKTVDDGIRSRSITDYSLVGQYERYGMGEWKYYQAFS